VSKGVFLSKIGGEGAAWGQRFAIFRMVFETEQVGGNT